MALGLVLMLALDCWLYIERTAITWSRWWATSRRTRLATPASQDA